MRPCHTFAFCTPCATPFRLTSCRNVLKTSKSHSSLSRRQRMSRHVKSHPRMNLPPSSSPPSTPTSQEENTTLKSDDKGNSNGNDNDSDSQPQKRKEDELTARVRQELAAEGIELDDLLDASSVLKLTREQDELVSILSTESSEGAVGITAEERAKKEARLAVVKKKLSKVRQEVMQPFLKKLFLIQGVVFAIIGGLFAWNIVPFYQDEIPLVGRALGFWTVWLFTIPALRARKGSARWEKSALNISFVMIPLLNLFSPTFTKNCGIIWTLDIAVLLGCYAYYLFKAVDGVQMETDVEQAKIKGLLRYLDWGSWR